MIKVILCLVALLVASAMSMTDAVVAAIAVDGRVDSPNAFSRRIIALYDSTERLSASATKNRIHRFAEMPLNQLGFVVDYWDVSKGLPSDEWTQDAQGFVTWFEDDQMKGAGGYLEWAAGQLESGKRFAILGRFGALNEYAAVGVKSMSAPQASIDRFFASFGVEYDGESTDNALELGWGRHDHPMTEFEILSPARPHRYDGIRLLHTNRGSSDTLTYLEVIRSHEGGERADVVAITPRGGYALSGYEIKETGNQLARWRIDPFGFFEAAFNTAKTPKPDPTTMNGRRVFYTHIDGDGVRNGSRFEKGVWAGETVYRDLIQPFDFPVTVSFITAEIDPKSGGSQRALNLARKMYRDPKVHPASHSFTHPFDWKRKISAVSVSGYSRPLDASADRSLLYGSSYSSGAVVIASDEEYIERETAGACRFIREQADPLHRSAMMFWTGDCEPQEEALERLEKEGILNLNGGDSRYDRLNPSYTTVAPFSAPVGRLRQIYSSNATENNYTELWHANFGNYVYVIETFLNTERPRGLGSRKAARRTSAADVYYHFYSGERRASLEGTAKALRFARARSWAAVTAADYARMVHGFMAARSVLDGEVWRVTDYKDCRTLRLDGTERFPDLEKSKNIMGFKEWAGHIYLHLDQAEEAQLVLTRNRPTAVYLESASSFIRRFEASDGGIRFEATSERGIEARVANAVPNVVYEGEWKDTAGHAGALSIKSEADGSLTVRLPAAQAAVVTLARKA